MPKVYLAAPFFNPKQVALVDKLEQLILLGGWTMFSPRKGENALQMNAMISAIKEWEKGVPFLRQPACPPDPPLELRIKVFNDNWSNVDDSDLMLAVIDNFDVGVMWEVGYAYARQVPLVTFTEQDFGCNLMLAQSTIGHLKKFEQVRDVLSIGNPALGTEASFDKYGEAVALIQNKYHNSAALKEGPNERA